MVVVQAIQTIGMGPALSVHRENVLIFSFFGPLAGRVVLGKAIARNVKFAISWRSYSLAKPMEWGL